MDIDIWVIGTSNKHFIIYLFSLFFYFSPKCNTKVSLEESKTREPTAIELAEDCADFINKSLVNLSIIISSFLFRKFLSCLGVEGFIYASKIYDSVLQQHKLSLYNRCKNCR